MNVKFLDRWHDDALMVNSTDVRYNDCWGITIDNKEYAIIGSTEGSHFLEITDENKLIERDFVPGFHQASTVVHRDIKSFGNYVYTVCDEGVSSLQIIDASYLPDSVVLVNELYDEFVNTHNLFIDTTNALLFSCGPLVSYSMSLQVQQNLIVYSLSNPENPIQVWQADPVNFPYVHDCYVRNGIAYLNCGDEGLRVYDFSNPSSPLFIQNITSYQEQGYNHQGWMKPDGSEFIFGDETSAKKLKRCSVQGNKLNIQSYFGTNISGGSIPHNVMLSNDFAYVAYYNEGLRIYDIRTPITREVAHYDTYPDDSPFKMEGAWGIYADLPSGRLLVSDRTYGLFLLDFNEELFSLELGEADVSVFPVPSSTGDITVKVNDPLASEINLKIYDLNGRIIEEVILDGQTFYNFNLSSIHGIYTLLVEYKNWKDEVIINQTKIILD